jgi:hypothetical protein
MKREGMTEGERADRNPDAGALGGAVNDVLGHANRKMGSLTPPGKDEPAGITPPYPFAKYGEQLPRNQNTARLSGRLNPDAQRLLPGINILPPQTACFSNFQSAPEGSLHLPGLGAYAFSSAHIHPDFSGFASPAVNDDIALLRLATPLPAGLIFPGLGGTTSEDDVLTLARFGPSGYGS